MKISLYSKSCFTAKQFRGSHSGLAIASVFEEMLATWAIPKSSVHVVVRDNAKNMVKGMEEAGVSSLSVCGTYSAAGRHRGSVWLKWLKYHFQPHAAVWKVKDSSAQCHTF